MHICILAQSSLLSQPLVSLSRSSPSLNGVPSITMRHCVRRACGCPERCWCLGHRNSRPIGRQVLWPVCTGHYMYTTIYVGRCVSGICTAVYVEHLGRTAHVSSMGRCERRNDVGSHRAEIAHSENLL